MTATLGNVAMEAGLSAEQMASFTNFAEVIEEGVDCLGFCMSEEDDTLSQWRGYADDGRGVSIGFNDDFLATCTMANGEPTLLQKVVYDVADQLRWVRGAVPRIKELVDKGALTPPSRGTVLTPKTEAEYSAHYANFNRRRGELFRHLLGLQPVWFSFKNPAFKEEREWRLTVNVPAKNKTKFRTANGRVVPYLELSFKNYTAGSAIDCIRLGPKHPTPKRIVQSFIESAGYKDTLVLQSEASYR